MPFPKSVTLSIWLCSALLAPIMSMTSLICTCWSNLSWNQFLWYYDWNAICFRKYNINVGNSWIIPIGIHFDLFHDRCPCDFFLVNELIFRISNCLRWSSVTDSRNFEKSCFIRKINCFYEFCMSSLIYRITG